MDKIEGKILKIRKKEKKHKKNPPTHMLEAKILSKFDPSTSTGAGLGSGT